MVGLNPRFSVHPFRGNYCFFRNYCVLRINCPTLRCVLKLFAHLGAVRLHQRWLFGVKVLNDLAKSFIQLLSANGADKLLVVAFLKLDIAIEAALVHSVDRITRQLNDSHIVTVALLADQLRAANRAVAQFVLNGQIDQDLLVSLILEFLGGIETRVHLGRALASELVKLPLVIRIISHLVNTFRKRSLAYGSLRQISWRVLILRLRNNVIWTYDVPLEVVVQVLVLITVTKTRHHLPNNEEHGPHRQKNNMLCHKANSKNFKWQFFISVPFLSLCFIMINKHDR